jgi:PAS domain S-box-containing protein
MQQNPDIGLIKNRIIDTTLLGAAIIVCLAYIFSLTRIGVTGFKLAYAVEFLVTVSLVAVTVFRRRFSYTWKVVVIIVLLFFMFLSDIINYGALSAIRVVIILIPFFSLFIFTMGQTIAIYLLAIVSFIGIGYLHHIQVLSMPYDANQYVTRIYPWVINSIHISLIAFVVLLISYYLNTSYERLLKELQESNRLISISEQSYREIFDSSSDAIFVHDLNGEIVDVNSMMLETYGYKMEDIPGLTIKDLSEGSGNYNQYGILEMFQKAVQTKNVVFDWRARKKNGELFWVEVALKPAQIIGETRVLAIVRDIDEKKKNAIELENYKNRLEILVRERTDELETTIEELKSANEELKAQRDELELVISELKKTQDQLIRSEKMASMGVLAAGLAHEINNPLNFIQGGIWSLEQYFEDKPKHELEEISPLINGMYIGVQRASHIISTLNHFSRQDDSLISECNIHDIIHTSLVILNNQFMNKIELVLDLCNEDLMITGNESRLYQAFVNIISNAAQAIEKDGLISVQTRMSDSTAIITISDNGPGIPDEIMPKITDPFFTTKNPKEGTGLGLFITYAIIQEHKGNISFQSEFGKGTNVILTLPIINPNHTL